MRHDVNPSPSDTFRRCASSSEESEESSEEEDKRDTHTRGGIDPDGRRDGRGGDDAINKLKRVPGGTNVGRERNY